MKRGGQPGGKFSEDLKGNHKKIMKEVLNSPGVRERHLAALALNHADPEKEKRRLDASCLAMQSDEYKKSQGLKSKLVQSRPEVKEKHRAAMAIVMAIPGFIENREKATRRTQSTPEFKEKFRSIMTEVNGRLEKREAVSKGAAKTIWVNDGKRNFRLKEGLPMPEGYSVGRYDTSKIGTAIWINDGIQNKRLAPDLEIPEGWTRGMLPRSKE